jgi:FSR family fosmidomycin resistance protein-like MFS transporter
MTQTTIDDISLAAAAPTSERRLVFNICFTHFVSHYYLMLLAPLFLFIRDDYGVSNTEFGMALTAFSVTTTLVQTPTGFLTDRVNPRYLLIGGLLLGAGAFTVAALVNSFVVFVAMFAVAGIANTVYHPADYTLLTRHVPGERVGKVFSYHTFAGMIGNTAAPPTLLLLQSLVGWRGAFIGAAALGVVAAVVLLLQRDPPPLAPARPAEGSAPVEVGWPLLLSPPILLNLLFFILISFAGGGLNNYLVVALGALHGTSTELANIALTGLLFLSAIGVLIGGVLTGRTSRHGLVSSAGLVMTGLTCVLVGLINFDAFFLVLLMSAAGFFSGLTMPSRDMIVRAATPPGAFGRVFGFVTTGFNIAGIVSPIIFGQLLDHGLVKEMFFFMAGCALLAIFTVAFSTGRKPATVA